MAYQTLPRKTASAQPASMRLRVLIVNAASMLNAIGLLSAERAARIVSRQTQAVEKGRRIAPWLNWHTISLALALFALAYGGYRAYRWMFVTPPCTDPTYISVAESLRSRPGEWSDADFNEITHSSGLKIRIYGGYSDDVLSVGGVGEKFIPPGCRADVLRETHNLIATRERRAADSAAAAIRKGLSK